MKKTIEKAKLEELVLAGLFNTLQQTIVVILAYLIINDL